MPSCVSKYLEGYHVNAVLLVVLSQTNYAGNPDTQWDLASIHQLYWGLVQFEDQIADQFPIIGMGYGYCTLRGCTS